MTAAVTSRFLPLEPFGDPPNGRNGSRRRILLVEDSAGDAELACERLSDSMAPALDFVRASTLAEALHLIDQQRIDAIILDLNLPDSRGVETVRRLKPVAKGTPVVAVTGLLDDALRDRVVAEGAEDVFSKDETDNRLFWRAVLQIADRRREQQRQLQVLLDATPDAILVVNVSGLVRYVNHAAITLFGRSRDELLGESIGFSVKDAEPVEITIPRQDGERHCEMRVVRLTWDDEQTYLASIRDVTERRQAEGLRARAAALEEQNRRIVEASRVQSQFLANMSHELRTPLNAIIGFSEIMLDQKLSPNSEQAGRFIGHILSSGRHLLGLVNDLLDLAKVEAGRIEFVPEDVSLSAVIDDVVTVLGSIAMKKNLTIQLDKDAAIDMAHLDAGRLKQILYNYLSNALKFSHPGGTVTVRTRAPTDGRFRLEVEDRGEGIATEDLPRLFNRFQQLDTSASRRHQGTGLGLALTKRLVEAQGGEVGVSSVLGQGSIFFAELPRHVPRRAGDEA